MNLENYKDYLKYLINQGEIDEYIIENIFNKVVKFLMKKEYLNITINNFIQKDVFDYIINELYLKYYNKRTKIFRLLQKALKSYNTYNKLIKEISQNYEKNDFKYFSLGIEEDIYDFTDYYYKQVRYFSIKDIVIKYKSVNSLYSTDNKITKDHINIPQMSSGFIINEFIKEGIYYDFKSFLKLFFEHTKVNVVTTNENARLSMKLNKWLNFRDKQYSLVNLYEIEEIYCIDEIKREDFFPTTTFQNCLLGSIKNRKETWNPYYMDNENYVSIFNNDKVVVDEKYIENVKKEVINQLNNHSK